MAGLELRQLEHARAFASDAPPARLAFYQLPVPAPASVAPQGMQLLADLLRISDPDLRSLLNDWLADVYVCADVDQALALRSTLDRKGTRLISSNSCGPSMS